MEVIIVKIDAEKKLMAQKLSLSKFNFYTFAGVNDYE